MTNNRIFGHLSYFVVSTVWRQLHLRRCRPAGSEAVDLGVGRRPLGRKQRRDVQEVAAPRGHVASDLPGRKPFTQVCTIGTVAQSIEPLSKVPVWFNSLWVRIMQVVGKNPLLSITYFVPTGPGSSCQVYQSIWLHVP